MLWVAILQASTWWEKNKNKGNSTFHMGPKKKQGAQISWSPDYSTILLPFNIDAEFPSPNFPMGTRASVASWWQTHVWFMREHVLGSRQIGFELGRDVCGAPSSSSDGGPPFVSHGRVRQTEYWDTVPFASLASKFHWASGKLETWPVCSGYSHESAGVRHT